MATTAGARAMAKPSQHPPPITDVYPALEFLADLSKVRNFFKAHFFMQANTRCIRQRYSADHGMYRQSLQFGDQGPIQGAA